MVRFDNIPVECYAGYRGEETPQRFKLGDTTLEITEVTDRWLAPEYRYFKVLANDHCEYILRHDSETGRWQLKFFRRDSPAPLAALTEQS